MDLNQTPIVNAITWLLKVVSAKTNSLTLYTIKFKLIMRMSTTFKSGYRVGFRFSTNESFTTNI